MHNLLVYARNNAHMFLLNFLKFMIVIATGSCRMGNGIQGVLEELYKQEAVSCLIASE